MSQSSESVFNTDLIRFYTYKLLIIINYKAFTILHAYELQTATILSVFLFLQGVEKYKNLPIKSFVIEEKCNLLPNENLLYSIMNSMKSMSAVTLNEFCEFIIKAKSVVLTFLHVLIKDYPCFTYF